MRTNGVRETALTAQVAALEKRVAFLEGVVMEKERDAAEMERDLRAEIDDCNYGFRVACRMKDEAWDERDALRARIGTLESFVKNVTDNYDCDEDGHRYDTGCRCCEAAALLGIAQSVEASPPLSDDTRYRYARIETTPTQPAPCPEMGVVQAGTMDVLGRVPIGALHGEVGL